MVGKVVGSARMIVDSVLLLGISGYERPQYAAILTGRNGQITDSYVTKADLAALGAAAMEKRELALDPETEVLGYALVNHGLSPERVAQYVRGVPYLLLLDESECAAFKWENGWVPDRVEIRDALATEVAVADALGEHDALARAHAKKVLREKVRGLRAALATDPGRVISQTGQLRKIIDGIVRPRGDSDAVVFEMLAEVVSRHEDR